MGAHRVTATCHSNHGCVLTDPMLWGHNLGSNEVAVRFHFDAAALGRFRSELGFHVMGSMITLFSMFVYTELI